LRDAVIPNCVGDERLDGVDFHNILVIHDLDDLDRENQYA
jgi:hypothetical protein